MSASANNSPRVARPSPLACTECRKKHLKCDALLPVCSRCIARQLHCSYTPSRRGCGSRSKPLGQRASPTSVPLPPTPNGMLASSQSRSTSQSWTIHNDSQSSQSHVESSSQSPASIATSRSSLRSEEDHLINLYYGNFHASHPILVPRSRFAAQDYPDYLRSAIQFVGSHYASNISSDSLRSAVASDLAASDLRTPEMVQALLLYAMALHARYEPMEAMPTLSKAASIALDLGMNRPDFATTHGKEDAVFEESLRRTWWELFVTDGYFAALHRQTSFKCNSATSHPMLPCDDSAYADGIIPLSPCTLEDFDDRQFSDNDWQFSSFCYRIDAIRILARVMAVSGANEAHPDSIQAIDNGIASWKFHLPNDKAGIIDGSGEVDQMMFQSHIFIQCASIFLHFPRSELPITMPPAAEITCAQKHMEQVSPTSTQHAVKAMTASKDLANLAALPVDKHSPFFICGLVFACIVQLSVCSANPRGSTQHNRDRVALIIGVLKSLSRNWAIAQYVSQQLKRAAGEIFKSRVETPAVLSSSSDDSGVDVGTIPGDMTWLDLFYNDGMHNQGMPGGEMAGM